MEAINKIMVPIDGSDTSKEAMVYAAALARAFHASVTILVVADDQYLDWIGPAHFTNEMMKQIDDNSIVQARKILDEFEFDSSLKEVEKVVRRGVPFQEIIDYASSEQVDMIVMGTRGRKGVPHLMMGSVAEKVVRLAPCPVLTVKKEK